MTRIVALFAILLTLSTGCAGVSDFRYGPARSSLPPTVDPESLLTGNGAAPLPKKSGGGVDGKSVAAGIGIGVGLSVVAVVVVGILALNAAEDEAAKIEPWGPYCPCPGND